MEQSSGRFGRLSIRGFRRLLDVSLELRPLTVLIGANGCGKTSVLDVLNLLSNSAQGRLGPAVSEMAGLGSVLTYDRAPELKLGLSFNSSVGEMLGYHLVLEPRGLGFAIREESMGSPIEPSQIAASDARVDFYDVRGELVESGSRRGLLETALSQVPKSLHGPEEFRETLAGSTFYQGISVGVRSPVRLPQQLGPAQLPGRDGEDLVSCLYSMRESHPERFEAVEDTLRVAFPRFKRLEFPPVAAGTVGLGWRDNDSTKTFYAHQLSPGTLRFLWLTALLQSPGLPALILLDEPEVSLHPEMVSLMVDQFREASFRSQLVIATQSDSLIRFLEPKEVVVCDSDEGAMTTLTRADELDLEEWLKEYSLDELWRNGRLGARG